MRCKIAALLVAWCAGAWAQSSSGYVFYAPGGANGAGRTTQFGGGGEVMLWKGLGLMADGGVWSPSEDLGSALGVFSPNASYHFLHSRESKLDPYVVGGYTLLFREGVANLFDFGVGTNYWFARRVGLHVEFRDQVYSGGGMTHLWGIRLGVAFR